jgi:molybdopterin/thiamine biosynthesis adenylyltransferase
MPLSDEQLERFSRHILLKDVGIEGQERILQGKVLIVGAGGLGAPAALYLAAAGVGTIGLVDGDVVDRTNLQRQVIHFTPDIGKPKVESAREKMLQINPDITVRTYPERVFAHNILDLIRDYDFVIDGTDNFPAKFLINDACVLAQKAFSHGGILRFDGQTMTYVPGRACYRCVFLQPPPKNAVPTCSQAGVLGAGGGGPEIPDRHRAASDRPTARFQRFVHGVPDGAFQTQCPMPDLRYASDHHEPAGL